MSTRHVLLLTASALAAGALPLHGQTIRQVPNQTHILPDTVVSVTPIDDWTGDGVFEYAVGAPFATTVSGPLSGQVVIFNGSTGLPIRTVNGASYPSCPGFPFPFGDELGFDMTAIADLDGDTKRELLATRRSAPQASGGTCIQPGHGGFMIMHSSFPTTPDFTFTSPSQNSVGDAAAGLDSTAGGVPTFVVGTGNSVQVWQRPTPGLPPALQSTITTFAILGSELCSAGTVGGLPAFAVNASGGQVFVMNIGGTVLQTIPGPGSSFGSSLAFLNDPGLPPALVIGAPAANNFDGQVDVWQVGGPLLLQLSGVPTSQEDFGLDVGTGGDVDGDGDQDFVALGGSGNTIKIADRFGNFSEPITLPVTLPVATVGQAVRVMPDMQNDGFDEVLAGGFGPNDESWVYFGGPDASSTSVGSSCSQGTPFLPLLGITGIPIITTGTGPTFVQTGASPGCLSALLAGTIDFVGTVVPPGSCLVHLQLNPAPVTGFTTITDAAGGWVGPTLSLTSPSLVGVEAAFQTVTISAAPGNPLEFSNALNLKVGW